MAVAQERQQQERDRDTALAWTIEAMARQKRLPSLTSLLNKGRGRRQSAAEMRAAIAVLREQYPQRRT